MVLNFTVGVIGAVIAFIYSLYGLVKDFRPDPLSAIVYFSMASLAAVSFAFSFLILFYVTTAGAVYVGAKLVAGNLRIEGGGGAGGGRPERVRYE